MSLCLQEIKAPASQIPARSARSRATGATGTAKGATPGSGCTCARRRFPQPPEFSHPPFDLETRIVAARVGALTVASIYVPNGGKDFPAKMKFLEALDAFAESFRAAERARWSCAAI